MPNESNAPPSEFNPSSNSPAGGAPAGAQAAVAGNDAPLMINTHYIKDLSFENPNAPMIYANLREAPKIEVAIDVGAQKLRDRLHETSLSVKVTATAGDKTAFLIELQFAALVTIGEKVPEEAFEPLLLVETPRYLFPFARNIVAEVSRDGGFPPLLINPVNFAQLRQQQAQQAAAGGAQAAPAAAAPSDGGKDENEQIG